MPGMKSSTGELDKGDPYPVGVVMKPCKGLFTNSEKLEQKGSSSMTFCV